MKKKCITGITILTMTAVLTACGGTGNSSAENAGLSDKSSALEAILQDEYNSDTDSPEETQTDKESTLSDTSLAETSTSDTSEASEAETTAENASSSETEKSTSSEPDGSKSDGIRPEFKEAMDSYEAFFDEYIAFMKEYANAGPENVLDMMGDYTEYLKQYAETMEKMEALDNGELSTAEALYYAEVTGRISKKLLEVAQ